jgi:hypothetical protein
MSDLDYDPRFLAVEFRISVLTVRDEQEPTDFVLDITGDLMLHYEERTHRVGWTRGTLFKLAAALDVGLTVFDLLDEESGESAQCLTLFHGNNLKRSVARLLSLPLEPFDPLLVERVVIYPELRGHDFGLLAMRTWISTFAGPTTLVACQPSPLNDDGVPIVDDNPQFRVGLTKLQRYWSKAGFRRAGSSDIYVATR